MSYDHCAISAPPPAVLDQDPSHTGWVSADITQANRYIVAGSLTHFTSPPPFQPGRYLQESGTIANERAISSSHLQSWLESHRRAHTQPSRPAEGVRATLTFSAANPIVSRAQALLQQCDPALKSGGLKLSRPTTAGTLRGERPSKSS